MATFNPYLNFSGNTEEAFNFYKSVFGGEFTAIQRFGETPVADKLSASEKNKLMHIALPIGKGNVLMGTDALESMGHKLTLGNTYNISIETESKEEAKGLFDKLSVGGKVETQIHDEFWGAYFGMFTDKFGIRWMVNYTYPKEK
jgi:PhnB protein